MIRPSTRLILTLILIASNAAAAQAAGPDPTVAQIVTRNIQARGGLEKIKGVRNLVLRGPPRADGRPGRFFARARPFYYLVGEPSPARTFAEGNDGSAWEFYADPGLVIRTTDAPAAASRHTSYFDDPLVSSLEPGWTLQLLGRETIGTRPTYRIRATYPDRFQVDLFVDRDSWLIIANRKVAPVHAFGDAIATETRISDYRDVRGALFPMRFDEYVIATGKRLEDMSGGWATVEANVSLPPDYFSPPAEPKTAIARLANAIYAARAIPTDALGWYHDFRANPGTSAIDTEAAIEAVGYQCLKNGAIPAALLLLEENAKEHPRSAAAQFGRGRAYRAAGREPEAVAAFRAALAIDPGYRPAADAVAQSARPGPAVK